MAEAVRYAIGDLSSLGGVSRRTVRYYVQEGLIPPPLGLGRGNHYTAEHLDQLLRVKTMQEAGRTLEEIRRALGRSSGRRTGERPPQDVLPIGRSLWRRIPLAPGVELHVAGAVRLPPPARLRQLSDWCQRYFAGPQEADREDEDRHA